MKRIYNLIALVLTAIFISIYVLTGNLIAQFISITTFWGIMIPWDQIFEDSFG